MNSIKSFDDIIYPITRQQFFDEYYGKKHLHVRAETNRFEDVMNWQVLNDILNVSHIWSSSSLRLVLDKTPIDPAKYCDVSTSRDNFNILSPDADKVMRFLEAGASLVANSIDSLTPNLRLISGIFEETLNAKSQGNLYCSWKQRQAFASHFDTHDVFAIHFEGEKVWQIYEGHYPHPINHESFKSLSREYHDKHKGKLLKEVELRPGDLLYIPRGVYHDALAASDGVIHIAFGMTSVIGLDAINALHSRSLQQPFVRSNLPLPQEGDQALKDYIKKLASEVNAICESDEFFENIKRFRDSYNFKRGGFDLPVSTDNARFAVMADVAITPDPKTQNAMLTTPKGNLPIPPHFVSLMQFVVAQQNFSVKELYAHATNLEPSQIDKFIGDIRSMKLISPHIPS